MLVNILELVEELEAILFEDNNWSKKRHGRRK